jgi:hypothetical protein
VFVYFSLTSGASTLRPYLQVKKLHSTRSTVCMPRLLIFVSHVPPEDDDGHKSEIEQHSSNIPQTSCTPQLGTLSLFFTHLSQLTHFYSVFEVSSSPGCAVALKRPAEDPNSNPRDSKKSSAFFCTILNHPSYLCHRTEGKTPISPQNSPSRASIR